MSGGTVRLLPGHHHFDVLLRVDHVATLALAYLKRDPVDLTRERAALHVALGSDSRPPLTADIDAFVGRDQKRHAPPLIYRVDSRNDQVTELSQNLTSARPNYRCWSGSSFNPRARRAVALRSEVPSLR
jgi:hypothetical protein